MDHHLLYRYICQVLLCFGLSHTVSGAVDINNFLFSGGLEFNDLSHPFDNETVYWPGSKHFEFTKKYAMKNEDGIWYSSNEFCASEHGGTHFDAPYHFGPDKWTVGQVPFEHLITPLLIIDLSQKVAGDPDFVLQKHHMDFLFNGDARRNFTVIFKFGWSQHYNDKAKYLGAATPTRTNLRFPGISEDVATWISETKTLVGVGVDTASVDPGSVLVASAHRVFAARNIFMLENINLQHDLPSTLCSIVVMPMKIQDGTGAPCRITAICPKILGHSLV